MFIKQILLGLGGAAAVGGIGYGVYSSTQSSNGEEGSSNVGGETDAGGGSDTEGGDSAIGGTDTDQQTNSQGSQTSPAPAAPSTHGQGTEQTQNEGQNTGK